MVTRFRLDVIKPNQKYAMTVLTLVVPCEPCNVQSTLAHPSWKTAMEEGLAALQKNQT